jgi:Protein of unknown function (DUF2975)
MKVSGSMKASRPDRVVRTITALASFAYFAMWFFGAFILTALPLIKAFGGVGDGFSYGLELPVTTPNVQTMVQTVWGQAPLMLDEVRGKLELPISTMPWSFLALLWSYTAVAGALMLLFLHNLRRIFQRVRDGMAFDAQNVARLRKLGMLLLALAGLKAVAEVATSIAVRRGLAADSSLTVPTGVHIDLTLVPVALVLIALAEVFRRGAELEHEQSLVV